MRTPFVAGNWKMNKTGAEARRLVHELKTDLAGISAVERVLCPPFMAIAAVAALLEGSGIGLGAQDLFWEPSGAYTGAVSAAMVAEYCRYVIIGHSERRAYFGETDETVNRKVKAALAAGLTPIVCVGETLAENESDSTGEVVERQVGEGLAGLSQDQAEKLVIAYEPVWAIGTGRAATPEGAEAVIREHIRSRLGELFGRSVAEGSRVLYGGSVTGANAAEFFALEEIDGALVGGASLKSADFIQITRAAA
ncbi:MAG TPA: triose-phosphate isomerase [Anaerolineales bacterium]|nr:triose-phosphate isomerase [Anaerolineales bacterium]